MSIARGSIGTIDRITNGTLNPGTPAGAASGGTFLLWTICFAATGTLTTPSGWSVVTQHSSVLQANCYALPIVTGSETVPSLTWSGSAYTAAIAAYFTGMDNTFTPTFSAAEKSTTSTNTISSPSVTRTPTIPNTFACIFGKRDKTAASNGAVYGFPAGFTEIIVGGDVPNGSNVSDFVIWYEIQTTATSISPNTGASSTGGGTDTANNLQTNVFGIGPGSTSIFVPQAPIYNGGMIVQVCQ